MSDPTDDPTTEPDPTPDPTGSSTVEAAPRAGWGRRLLVGLAAALLGLLGAGLALLVWGPVRTDVGPVRLGIGLAPAASGESVVDLAPLGAVTFDTHDTPLRFRASIDDLESTTARTAVETGKLPDLSDAQDALPLALARTGGTILLVGVAGGALVAGLALRRRSAAVIGAVAPLVLLAGTVGAAAATFDLPSADPTCTGAVGLACEGVARVREAAGAKDTAASGIGSTAESLAQFYLGAVGADDQLKDSTYRLLLVSDIHLNPTAFGFASRLANAFDVDALVNVGDDADWGGDVGNIVGGPQNVDAPYLWTRGNHDSLETQRANARAGAVVLDGNAYDLGPLSFWGIGDPTFSPKADKSVERLGEKKYKQKWSAEVLAPAVARLTAPPDVLLVHDPNMASGLTVRPKLTLSGHTHKFKATSGRNPDGTPWALVTNGSTGGAGLRVLDTGSERPMQACVIWIDKESEEPLFLDLFSFRPLIDSTYSAERVSLLPPG